MSSPCFKPCSKLGNPAGWMEDCCGGSERKVILFFRFFKGLGFHPNLPNRLTQIINNQHDLK